MNRYSWVAIDRDGNSTQRWNADGTENTPHATQTVEFHLLPSPRAFAGGLRPYSLFLKDGQRLIYKKRRGVEVTDDDPTTQREDTGGVVYVVGIEEDHEFVHFSSYAALLPDGRVEHSSNYNHITRHERNLDEHPLKFYETWDV